MPPFQELDLETMKKLLNSTGLKAFVKDYEKDFLTAMSMDITSFPNDNSEQISTEWEKIIASYRLEKVPFRITMHIVENERILLCQSSNVGTYIAYRGNISAIEDCTFWKITLVFTLIAGVVDIIFGIKCYLTNGLVSLFRRSILTNSKLMNLLAGGINSSIVMNYITTLYREGLLKPILKEMILLGFFTFLRLLLRLVAICTGYAGLALVASFVSTAAELIILINQRPASCDPLPTIDLEEINFNCTPRPGSVTALSIVHTDYSSGTKKDINNPIWKKGDTVHANSPVAYVISETTVKKIGIEAKFCLSTNSTTTVEISVTGGGNLGVIGPVSIIFSNAHSSPQTVYLEIPKNSIGVNGIQMEDITWTWYYKIGNGEKIRITDSSHRIYALLNLPTLPWSQKNAKSYPRTDVLDYACEWAKERKTVEDAAAAITSNVNSSIGLTYESVFGSSSYTQYAKSPFYCTYFIEYLRSLPAGTGGNGNVVNCTDCAAIVTTFSNILGCDLYSAVMGKIMGTKVDPFLVNKIIAIGKSDWDYPFISKTFSYHEVAWKDTNSIATGYNTPIYDACLKIDNSDDPWKKPNNQRIAILPTNIPFSTQSQILLQRLSTPFSESSYRERLADNDNFQKGINNCQYLGHQAYSDKGRRSLE